MNWQTLQKVKLYLKELSDLVDIAEQERMLDVPDDDNREYSDGFLAGYRQGIEDAKNAFNSIF